LPLNSNAGHDMTTNLFDKIGVETRAWLNSSNKKKHLLAIHHEPKGARIVIATGETVLIEGLTKDETTRLFLSLGFIGKGKNGFDTPAFPPFLKPTK